MNYRLSRLLMWVGIDGGMVFLAASMCFKNEKIQIALMIAAVAVFALGVLQAFLFYRCPECGCRLMMSKGGIPENCPQCGVYLRLEDKYEAKAPRQEEEQQPDEQQ